MFKALLKTRFAYLFSLLFRTRNKSGKTTSPTKKILIGFLILYLIGTFSLMFGSLFGSICEPYYEQGIGWLYFTMIILFSVLFCFIGSVFFTKSEVYDSHDNDLLLSMPIPPRMILLSRLLSVTLLSYIYEFLILIPASVVYAFIIGFSPLQLVFLIIIALIIPLISMTLSLIFGGIIAYLESKMRHKNIFTLVLSMVLLFGYLYVYTSMTRYSNNLVENGLKWATDIKENMFILYCGGNAIAAANPIDFIFFFCFAIIPFVLVCMVLAVSFIKIITSKRSAAKIAYNGEIAKKSTVLSAFIRRENSHFWASPMYVMNASIGCVFLLILAVAIPIKADYFISLILEIPSIKEYVGLIVTAVICFIVIMNIISAPSISVEGKSFWILKSLPVNASEILISKVYFHLCITILPTLIASVSACIFLPSSLLDKIMIILLPQALNAFIAFLGVSINLQFPKFDWVNETAAVKQSGSSILTVLAGMGAVFVSGLLFIVFNLFLSPAAYMFVLLIIFVSCILILRNYLLGKGAQKFNSL